MGTQQLKQKSPSIARKALLNYVPKTNKKRESASDKINKTVFQESLFNHDLTSLMRLTHLSSSINSSFICMLTDASNKASSIGGR